MMKHLLIILLSLWGLVSCTEKEGTPVESAPAIGILSVTPDTLLQFVDSAFVTLQYEDPNGDIGSDDPDVNDLEVKDSRISSADFYHVQPLTPDGMALFIRGKIRIKLNTLFLLGTGDFETTSFSIRLRDQNGNWSETVTTDPIVIKRQ